MNLPKVSYPTHSIVLPFSKQTVRYRLMNGYEEKHMLMTLAGMSERGDQEEDDYRQTALDILELFLQTLRNVLLSDVDPLDLPMRDVDVLIANLRAKSIGDVQTMAVRDKATNDYWQIEINILEDMTLIPNTQPSKIMIPLDDGREAVLEFESPTLRRQIATIKNIADDPDNALPITTMRVLKRLVIDPDGSPSVVRFDDLTPTEVIEWMLTLPKNILEEIRRYASNVDSIEYRRTLTRKDGTTVNWVLRNHASFFE